MLFEKSSVAETLDRNGWVIYYTVGTSMEPMLHNRKSIVRIEKMSHPLKKNDLPLYRRPDGKLILHRIIYVGKNKYITRGDNRACAETVPFEWVLGVVTEFGNGVEMTLVDDPSYLNYLHTLPAHARKLRLALYRNKIKRRIAKLLGRA